MKNPRLVALSISALCAVVLLAPLAGAQEAVRTVRAAGTIREKPPGELATVVRRDPDFRTIKYLGMQRDYRDELRSKLMLGHAVIRHGRPVLPMEPIVWPPEPAQ